MKTIELTQKEYCEFIKLAEKFKIVYTYTICLGMILVEADAGLLEYLGF